MTEPITSTIGLVPADGPIYLNGRFHLQPMTGVQRYATEIAAALDRLASDNGISTKLVMLTPRGIDGMGLYRTIQHRSIGRLRGHLWEQLELPSRTCGNLLVNLGNSGPIFKRHQLIVLHDANIYAVPETYSRLFKLWHKTLHRLYLHSSVRIATISQFSAAEIARHLKIDGSRILGPTLEGADHILRTAPDPTILQRHGLAQGCYVLAVGSLARHKNLSALATTAAELAKRGIDLAVVGSAHPGVFNAEGIVFPQPAKYLGRVNDAELRALYEHAACFVFPSRYEGFGIPPIEAMACHCPVVAASAGAVLEACGKAALYCNPDDHAAIAAAIGRVIDEPDLAATLRERGRLRAQFLTWENAARRLINLIEEMQQSRKMS